ncbi:hypothetical protein [Baia soyae]|nr:hypothetical protein [Baia soyae]
MSVQASLDFHVAYGEGQNKMSLFDAFISNGWQWHDEDNEVFFLPVGDIDDYDWQSKEMSLTQL